MELNRRLFLVLTFVLIVIIVSITKDMTQAMLFITMMTNYLVLTHYIMVSVKEVSDEPGDAKIQAIVDARVAEQQKKISAPESFTGFYVGNKPQFGLGSGLEIEPVDADFELESVNDKCDVMSDESVDHTPTVPPLTTDPDQYMDIDDKNSFLAQARQRDKRAIEGKILANRDHFSKYYEEEVCEAEKRNWWGNRSQYEPTVTYGELHYKK